MNAIELRNVSRWYGNIVAINDISMSVGPGVTGLLGPNGAGKSTLLHMIAGFLQPSRGEVTIDGRPSWRNAELFRTVGLVPELPSVYAFMTGAEFVRATAKLHELADPDAAARRAIGIVELADAQDRKIATYSKGMRQRIKVAAALVHNPEVILLDEPFNGMDPRQRLHMMDLLHELGADGRTILFSSHILEEVERLSGTIQVMVSGRLAVALIGEKSVSGVEIDPAVGLTVRASDYGSFTRALRSRTPGASMNVARCDALRAGCRHAASAHVRTSRRRSSSRTLTRPVRRTTVDAVPKLAFTARRPWACLPASASAPWSAACAPEAANRASAIAAPPALHDLPLINSSFRLRQLRR